MIKNSNSNSNNPIGIFDSGVGGLTVVKEVIKALPNEDIIYFGDTARVPYGSKSKETVTKFSKQIVNFLMSKNVKAIIIACGTVSSNSYDELVKSFDIPIIDVVTPATRHCLETNVKKVGVIGTERTISSQAYEIILKQHKPDIEVFSKACPLFVPLAEEGWTDNLVAEMTAEIYLRELVDKGIESIILGCTHYPLLMNCIKKVVGNTLIINPAESTAEKMKQFLVENEMLNTTDSPSNHSFYVSDNSEKFSKICNLVLNENHAAGIVDIERY